MLPEILGAAAMVSCVTLVIGIIISRRHKILGYIILRYQEYFSLGLTGLLLMDALFFSNNYFLVSIAIILMIFYLMSFIRFMPDIYYIGKFGADFFGPIVWLILLIRAISILFSQI